jgi:hypothetical protein
MLGLALLMLLKEIASARSELVASVVPPMRELGHDDSCSILRRRRKSPWPRSLYFTAGSIYCSNISRANKDPGPLVAGTIAAAST